MLTIHMTTRLEGAHTYFLPFNQGSNGAGKVGGKGNPVNPNGYDTAYLWEKSTLQRQSDGNFTEIYALAAGVR